MSNDGGDKDDEEGAATTRKRTPAHRFLPRTHDFGWRPPPAISVDTVTGAH